MVNLRRCRDKFKNIGHWCRCPEVLWMRSWAVRWCICPCSLATISKFRFRFFLLRRNILHRWPVSWLLCYFSTQSWKNNLFVGSWLCKKFYHCYTADNKMTIIMYNLISWKYYLHFRYSKNFNKMRENHPKKSPWIKAFFTAQSDYTRYWWYLILRYNSLDKAGKGYLTREDFLRIPELAINPLGDRQ